jgi:hypothetical protein
MFSTQVQLSQLIYYPNDYYRALRSLVSNSPSILPGSKRAILVAEEEHSSENWSNVIEQLSKLGVEIYAQDNYRSPRDTFLDSLVDFSKFDESRTHIVHFSPLSYFMSRQLHATLSALDPSEDSIMCSLYNESKDQSFATLMNKYEINLVAASFDPNIVLAFRNKAPSSNFLYCSADLIVVPRSRLSRLIVRVRSLHSRLLLATAPRGRHIDDEDLRSYSALVLNLALIEEGWAPFPLLAVNTDVPTTAPLLLGRHPFSAAYVSHVVHFAPEELYFGPGGEAAEGCAVHVSEGSAGEDLRAHLQQSLAHGGGLVPCQVMAGLLQVLPQASFVEIGGTDVFQRASMGHTGCSVISGIQGTQERTASLSSRTHRLLSLLAVGDFRQVSLQNVFDHMKSFTSRVSYLHVHGCADAAGKLHRPSNDCSSSDLTANSELDLGADLYALLAPLTELAPCVVSVSPAVTDATQMSSFESHMHKLGFVVVREAEGVGGMVGALGPHCSTGMFDWVRDLVQGEALVRAMPTHLHPSPSPFPVSAGDMKSGGAVEEDADEGNLDDMSRTFPVPAGVALLAGTESGSDPIVAIENILPSRLLELLEGRLRHRSKVTMGANSHFIAFKRGAERAPPRSLVEMVILKYLAPLAVGTQVGYIYN